MANAHTLDADNRRNALAPQGLDAVEWIALILMIVGGLNWGLVALFNIDLVASIFGPGTTASRIVYGLVGLAALYGIWLGIHHSKRRTV